MFIVFYTVKIVYICVFMTHSTSCCLSNTQIHGLYVCMYTIICKNIVIQEIRMFIIKSKE
jgi:hypothetical protein